MSNYSEPSEISKLFVCVCFYICIVPRHLPVQCATSLPSTWYRYCTTSLFSAVCYLTSQYMVLVLYHVTFQCSVLPHFPVHGTGIVSCHLPVQCATSVPSARYSIIACSHVRSTSSLIFEKISFQTLAFVLSNWSFKLQVHWPYRVKRGIIICNLDDHTLNLHEYQTLWDLRSSKRCGWRFLSSGMLCNVYWLTVTKIWLLLMLWSSGSSSPCCSSKAL